MATASYNPSSISEQSIQALLSSIQFPAALAIAKLSTQGQYHLVYTLEYAPSTVECLIASASTSNPSPHHPSRLLLRISGDQLPHLKTENESAILAYVAKHPPSIPVPIVLHHDSSMSNPIGFEYQVMTICPGVEIDSVFREWDQGTKNDFLDQMAVLMKELHSIPVHHIGGFTLANEGVVPGPICEEFLWQKPGIEKYWNGNGLDETPESINAQGPFATWTDLNIGWLNCYISAIQKHPLMAEFRDMVPLLSRFINALKSEAAQTWKLDEMRIVLAHRDLHFGNILYDTQSKRISGIIDWEFSGSAPFCAWDPPKAFLASVPYDEEGLHRKRAWVKDFQTRCEETGVDWRELMFDRENGWASKEQRLVYEAVDYMRCIFEVAPTGERLETVRSWKSIVIERLDQLGIS